MLVLNLLVREVEGHGHLAEGGQVPAVASSVVASSVVASKLARSLARYL